MAKRNPETAAQQARARISHLRDRLTAIDYLCSGTLLKTLMKCGQPSCRCQQDPTARNGPYYRWGQMKAGKLVQRYVSAEQAVVLRRAIANYRQARKLMRAWEVETERIIDAEAPHNL